VIDSHCHLNFKSIRDNFTNVINNAKNNKLTSILTINTNPSEFYEHLDLIKSYNYIYISYGLHPQEVKKNTVFELHHILSETDNPKVIGIGETGLDFYHSKDSANKQYEIFETHIQASIKTSLPLIIHQRNSEKEIMEVLKKYQSKTNLSVVFHCFTGSKKLLNFCLDNNFYISISGIITFKNAKDLRNTLRTVPLNRLLIETDSPYLSPVPKRGKVNEPSFVKYTAEYLSNFFKLSLEEFEKITDNNFFNLFTKAKRDNYL
tara:strand:+ start:790 stop:1575 length:786 start_codon:yes stop_codon:yes gene_type:complete